MESHTEEEHAHTPLTFPPLSHEALDQFAFSSWYPQFRSVTIKSKIIPVSDDFISYLSADGLFIPGTSNITLALSDSESDGEDESIEQLSERFKNSTVSQNDDESEEDEDEDKLDSADPHFPELERQIESSVDELGGEVFPKLNWSSPRDASWIATTNTLKCHNAADIFLLLKSSDFVAHDLTSAYEDCSDEFAGPGSGVRTRPATVEIVLRKWFDLAPSMEFRCFVRDNKLIGICQRDMTYYAFLKDIHDEVEEKIEDFFEAHVENRFPNANYTFDVYITRNRERIYLIDFNPLAQKTDSLLFEWEEILLAKDPLPLRLLASEKAGEHMKQPFAFNRYPADVTDLSNGQTVAQFAEAFYHKVNAAK